MREIARGAEAVIYEHEGNIVKHRPAKSYRIKEIDDELRRRRTKKEASVLDALQKKGLAVPCLIDKDADKLTMQKIDGQQLKAVLDSQVVLAESIGQLVAEMHAMDIIHGDLTTSNMILDKGKVFLIDFGLSIHSTRIEDKAVDIHLFLQALESRHYKVKDKAFLLFKKGYSAYKDHDKVLQRLEIVEKRGRHKKK